MPPPKKGCYLGSISLESDSCENPTPDISPCKSNELATPIISLKTPDTPVDYEVKQPYEESERSKSEEETKTAETVAENETKMASARQKAESARAEVQKAQYRADELTKQEMLAESITL
jgi:hypothetical protein